MALSNSTTRNVTVLSRLLGERRPLVMGILNVTPDSFSDGGRFADPQTALAHARQMIADGADIIDVGAESTRPYVGAEPVSLDDEIARLSPVLRPLIELGAPVSIDTMKAKVAAWALDQGASILNDVWGLQRDPDMARVAAEHGAPVVVMHNREQPDPALDIMTDIEAFFMRSLDIALKAGISARKHRARSGHRLWEDAGAKYRGHCAAGRTETLRLADPGRPLPEALHQRCVAIQAG